MCRFLTDLLTGFVTDLKLSANTALDEKMQNLIWEWDVEDSANVDDELAYHNDSNLDEGKKMRKYLLDNLYCMPSSNVLDRWKTINSYGYSHCYCGHRLCKTGRRRLFRCRSDPICKESSRNVGNKACITSANNERARTVALQNSSNPTSHRRLSEFAQLMLEKLQTGEIDVKKIWFSDEAYFTLDGPVNKQNYRYWGRERPEITVVRSLHLKKFLVWCAISSHGVFGPIFIDGTLSAANYRELLDEEFIPFLHGHDLDQGHWFMQGAARPYRTADVFEVLNENFSDRIIGLVNAAEVRLLNVSVSSNGIDGRISI
ncbi:t-complex protein 1 subunit delta, partial [Trichonephila clavata]